jgi:succinate dehydrogenase / fumarate reductase flavoprotein subunit
VPSGINGANRLGGNSLSDLLVFGKRAGEYAAKFAKDNAGCDQRRSNRGRWTTSRKKPLEPFERGGRRENPYRRCSTNCRTMMQELVGIVASKSEMQRRSSSVARSELKARAEKVTASPGNREYNPGWHTALDLRNCSPSPKPSR